MSGVTFRGPRPGERFGRFRIETAWTRGPLGPTARARMIASERPATLIALRDVRSPLDPIELARELAALRTIDDAIIAPIDAWPEEGALVVAYEDAIGEPLDVGRLDPTTAVEVVVAAARALAAAHARSIAHGLLVPPAILRGPQGAVRIAFAGVSRLVPPAALLRITGATLAGFLSPEQARERPATPASDVHALGACLHALLTGRAPFEADTGTALLAEVAVAEPAPLPGSLPDALRASVARALAKDPRDRFSDAGALADALAAAGLASSVSSSVAIDFRKTPQLGDDEVVWGGRALEPSPAGVGRRADSAWRGRGAGRAPRFSGALAQQQLAFAKQHHGEARVARALASLDPTDRDEVAGATPISWVRIDAFERFHVALARELGRDVTETHAECVVGGSRRTFNTLWRMLLRVGGVRLVMTRAPVVYGKTYDTGVMESRDIGDEGGKFVLTEWPDVPEFVLRGLRAGMTAALENVGRTGVVVTSTRTSDGAVFAARWDR